MRLIRAATQRQEVFFGSLSRLVYALPGRVPGRQPGPAGVPSINKMATRKRETPILQLHVRGPGVGRGRIRVPDLIRICQEAQTAVTKQAEALEGRKTIHPGPTTTHIQHECTLELIGIKAGGSTTLQFGLAKRQMPLVADQEFGVEVVEQLASTIKSLRNGSRKNVDPGVLRGLYGLGSVVQERRVDRITWIAPKHGTRPRVAGTLDLQVTERVAARLSAPRRAMVQVDGVLDMADFKPKDRKCRIDPAIGASIMCAFDARHENLVYSLLRKPVRAKGEATLQPYTERIEFVHIHTIEPLLSLSLGEGNFFSSPSITELANAQKVRPLSDLSVLAGGIPRDLDVEEFLEEIYSARK